jgi:rhodanese-related sulfurtransferase
MQRSPKTISASEFKKVIQAEKKPQIIDVRTAAEVANQSLEDSTHFPLQDLNCADIKAYLKKQNHDPEHPVYLLCASGQRATRAAEQLKDDLDCPLVIIDGGIGALNTAGISVQQGTGKTISLERQVRITSGCLVLLGVILGSLLNPWFYTISALVGTGLAFSGITDSCGMAMLLARMPWNRAR